MLSMRGKDQGLGEGEGKSQATELPRDDDDIGTRLGEVVLYFGVWKEAFDWLLWIPCFVNFVLWKKRCILCLSLVGVGGVRGSRTAIRKG